MGYLYIFATLILTVYGQLILKWRLTNLKIVLPEGISQKFVFLVKLIFDPYILSGFIAAFLASLFWMAAMTKFEITIAYPFMSLAPVLVFICAGLFLGEAFTVGKVWGLVFIVIGIFVTVKY